MIILNTIHFCTGIMHELHAVSYLFIVISIRLWITFTVKFWLTFLLKNSPFNLIKFSFSEKATKIWESSSWFWQIINVKTMRKIAQIFVAFSKKLNFTEYWYISNLVTNSRLLKRKVKHDFTVKVFCFNLSEPIRYETPCIRVTSLEQLSLAEFSGE